LEVVETAHVEVKIVGAKVIAWPRGQREILRPDTDRFYHLTLAPGEGIFVEVE
jgi:hypothetical protein